LLAAAWPPSKESHIYCQILQKDSFRKDLVLDVAIACPLKHKYLKDASVTAGFACNDCAENIKQKNFQVRVEQEGFVYLPFIRFLKTY
jgi:hypothetical protein